jgi:hypothetical protein
MQIFFESLYFLMGYLSLTLHLKSETMDATLTHSEEDLYKKRNRIRIAVSLFFFCQGIAFASWASRIPLLKLIST